ncbi:MAG: hypothetical protein ACK5NK_05915 [Niabella sp.]
MIKHLIFLFALLFIIHISHAQKPITNDDILSMKNAKFSEKNIISTMATGKCDFDLTTTGLIALKSQKLSDKIIKSMFIVSPPKSDFITNEEIIKLSTANISTDLINIKIRLTPHKFDISPSALIKLKNAKVPKTVVSTMTITPEND